MASWVMQLTADWNNKTGNFETDGTWLKDGQSSDPPTANNPMAVGDRVNWGVAVQGPSNLALSQLVVTVGKFRGNDPLGSMASPFRTNGTSGGPMCLIEQTAAESWGNPAAGFQGFASFLVVNQDPNNKGARSKYEFTLVAIWEDSAGILQEYGCDPEIDVDNGV